jgi:hypothetical protein
VLLSPPARGNAGSNRASARSCGASQIGPVTSLTAVNASEVVDWPESAREVIEGARVRLQYSFSLIDSKSWYDRLGAGRASRCAESPAALR